MLINIHCAKCVGIEAVPVTVEVDIASGLGVHLVGLADAAVKESLLRTITAMQSMGFRIPGKKIVINLAPADMHKKGSGYDLPITPAGGLLPPAWRPGSSETARSRSAGWSGPGSGGGWRRKTPLPSHRDC